HISYRDDELLVACLVRNGEVWIPSFVEHYLNLGVKHIVFLDNDSTDATVSLASHYPFVSVFQTKMPFKNNNASIRRYLVKRFAQAHRWVLCVDIDEYFDYPYSDRLELKSFLSYLNHYCYTAVVAYLLDLFSNQPLCAPEKNGTGSIKERYRFYDLSAVTKS